MSSRIPTHFGDALILESTKSIRVHAVGLVTHDGQQDFHTKTNVKYVGDHATAVAAAKNIARAGRRIFLRNVDVGGFEWSEISY